MADILGDTSSIWVELDANGRVGFKTKTLSVTLDGIATDIIFSDYRFLCAVFFNNSNMYQIMCCKL